MPAATQDVAELKRLLARYDYDTQDPAYEALVKELGGLLRSGELSLEDIARYLHTQDVAEGIANTSTQTITKEHARRAVHGAEMFDRLAPGKAEAPIRPNLDKSRKTPATFPELMQDWLMHIPQQYEPEPCGMGDAMSLWLQETGLKDYLTLEDVKALTYGEKAPGERLGRYLAEEVPSSICRRPTTRRLAEEARRHDESPAQQVELPESVPPRYRIHPGLVPFKMLLRHWRENSGLTLDTAAQHTGFSRDAFWTWERLDRPYIPSPAHFPVLAEAYHIEEPRFHAQRYSTMIARGKAPSDACSLEELVRSYCDLTHISLNNLGELLHINNFRPKSYASSRLTTFSVSDRLKLRSFFLKEMRERPGFDCSSAQLEALIPLPDPAQAKDFGTLLTVWLQITGMTQKEFAAKVGMEESSRPYTETIVCLWKRGKQLCQPGRLETMIRIFRTELEAQPWAAELYTFDAQAEAQFRALAGRHRGPTSIGR
jgi:transcriptional regulator with XRE-family HTH domain